MRTGIKVGLLGCAIGFVVAVYFAATPLFSELTSGEGLNTASIGAMLGVGFCAAGTLIGLYFGRRGRIKA